MAKADKGAKEKVGCSTRASTSQTGKKFNIALMYTNGSYLSLLFFFFIYIIDYCKIIYIYNVIN